MVWKMLTSKPWHACVALAVVLILMTLACGEDEGRVPKVIEPAPTLEVTTRKEIASALTGFLEAVYNHDAPALDAALSASCDNEDRRVTQGVSALLFTGVRAAAVELSVSAAPGKRLYRVAIDPGRLAIARTDVGLAVLPVQPKGTVMPTIAGHRVAELDDDPLPVDTPIVLVWERGNWRVVCQ